MNDLEKQINFIKEIELLKTVKRQNLTLDDMRQENSAEHSWHLAMMAMVLVKGNSISDESLLKIIKLLLIHDLGEIYDGDTFLYDDEAREKSKSLEEKAVIRLAGMLPREGEEEILGLWKEYEERSTYEAKIAGALDSLQPLLNHSITAPDEQNPYGLEENQVIDKKKHIKDDMPELWPVAKETIEKCVDKGLFKRRDG
ncbi:HD domain-containing protein [Vallitalea okinawensis]|uniref:HD domain-containing protein n=1 Tax=Vallitalea okinawensis TaxID=2078660 RepID=UPI000CFC855B|nr:HD domain-containing protein [Vallitalea okinawensis]